MALTTNFNQVTLSGLNIDNPTSLQFGPDGRLYVSQQNGIIKIANVQAITDGLSEITGYEVVGQVETINLVKAIPNHDDNGDLNTQINTRQVTGLVVDQDAQGKIVLYVSSSDPRIGGGSSGQEKDLDTNSGIISRLTLANPSAPLGDSRWNKVDLVIGLPRSEENHSTNGLDIRTELVDGEEHQIMYVASGGNTNKGAPSNNFAWTPEYYYSTAILRVDLTQLEQIEATEGLKGGTSYVDSYVYALPTLNDPTRTDNLQGQDTANGSTGTSDAEAADTFGGNDGRNQAKYDPNGAVQVYSTGYRNHYDVVITEAGNLYTFDNGPNNGWGDRPLTADGNPVNTSEQIGTNNPNVNVDTGDDRDRDNLHLVTESFYGGHPHPVYASGADAGLYTVDASSGSPVVTQLTDISDSANDPSTTEDDLPSDWNTISGGITHPEADVYLGPGNNPAGNYKGADSSLLTISTSSNGLTEYTADGLSDNPNAEVLAVASFNNNITFIEIKSDGTQGGTNVTNTQAVNVGGLPLDLTAVGNNGIDGSGKFAGTVWVAQFGADGITILTPGTPPAPDIDQDDDGLDDNVDRLQYDAANGVNTVLNAGETLFWDFNPADSGQYPGKGTSAEGPFNVGLTGWMIDGVDYLDGLRNLDNTIRGGAPGIIQVKSVGAGDLLGSNNTQQDAIQTGFLPASDVKEFRIKIPIFNPFSSDANNGINWSDSASMGFTLGDGTMSNFLQIAVGAKNSSGSPLEPIVRVTYEENDLTITELEIDANELSNSVDDDLVELFLDVDLATYQISPSWRFQTAGIWSQTEQIGDNPVQLDVNGQIAQALQGELYIDGVQSAPVVTLTSTSNGSEPFTADFLDLTIESTAALPNDNSNVLYRINVGGAKVAAADGSMDWSEDTNSNPSIYRVGSGGDRIYTNATAIDLSDVSLPASVSEAIFQTERWDHLSGSNMQWEFDLAQGDYEVRLFLAEIYSSNDVVGDRVFDVAVEGSVPEVFNDIDPFASVGQYSGFMLSHTTTVDDGSLSLEFLHERENPALKGIEILSLNSNSVLPSLSIDDVTVNEDAGTAGFTVNLSAASPSEVKVDFATADDTAVANSDYITTNGTLTFVAGEISQTITVNLTDDEVDENNETFSVKLSNAVGANITDDTGIGTIVDNDISQTTIRIEGEELVDTSVYRLENNAVASGGQMLSLLGGSSNEIGTASFTFDGTSGLYNIVLGIFDENDGQGQFKLTQNSSEVATVTLNQNLGSNLANAITYITPTVANSQLINSGDRFTLTGFENNKEHVRFDFIEFRPVDGDYVTPELSIDDVTVNEDADTAGFTVNLSAASNSEVKVDFATADDTAVANSDYITTNGTLTFAAGETSQTITVNITDDEVDENSETLKVNLFNAVGATIGDDTGIGTIVDNDSVNNNDVIAPFADINPVDTAIAGQIGAAHITITPGSGIQTSNFGTSSFTIKNTGDKRIAAIYFDVTNALFPDTVFDPVGLAGDSVSRGLTFSNTGNTGVFQPGTQQPERLIPFYGQGGVDGYEGMLLTFDPNQDGGYETGEIIKFGVDMDPNSIAGLPQKPKDINGNDPRLNSWDIGGVSGAELINSEVHVLFTDGTTAVGELGGDGSQGGAVAVASQSSPDKQVSLTVNGIDAGGSGSYTQNDILVKVSGQAGDVARVVLTKGFIQPFDYVDPNGNAIDLSTKFTGEAFPANNAIQFQTVDVTLDGTVQDITSLFNFGSPGGNLSFSGDDELPIGLVASIIDSNELPVGSVTEPIYLVHGTDDTPTIPSVSIEDVTVNEDAGTATFAVNLSEASTSEVKVDFATADNTAVADSDYTATNGTLSFTAGQTSQIITVDLTDDEIDENNETFSVKLSNAIEATIVDDTGTGTIIDNDSINDPSVLYRINVGGAKVAAADGSMDWSEDTNTNPSIYRVGSGGANIYTNATAIDLSDVSLPASVSEAIFQTERWDHLSGSNMQWEFDLAQGDYEVRLFLAEIYSSNDVVGDRVFDVAVEGSVPEVFNDIDPFASVGQYSGFMLSHTTTVDDGSLSLEFLHERENPALKGIEILSVESIL